MSESDKNSSEDRKSRSEKAKEINYPDPNELFVQMKGDSADFEEPSQRNQSQQDSDDDSE